MSSEIHAVADALTELSLQSHELEEADRPAEFDAEIDVALLTPCVAGERTEDGQTSHSDGVQNRTAGAECLQPWPHDRQD